MIEWPKGTIIFAHRGASGYAPENTLPAFELAADMHAAGIEFDVQITKDQQLIIHHDRELGRTEEASGLLSDWNFRDLRALDVGSWFGSDFAGVQMPTPTEVVEAVGQRLLLNFELINDTPAPNGVGELLVALFRRMNLFHRAMISSFNPLALWQVRQLEPRITLGALWSEEAPYYAQSGDWATRIHPEALHPNHDLVTPQLVEDAHARGQRVHTWTVNDADVARRMRDLGIDMVMGDYPDQLHTALHQDATEEGCPGN
jgi:glycerophosphoryl diester phosphodiesterase